MSTLRAISVERSTLVDMPIRLDLSDEAARALYMLTSNALLFEELGPEEEEVARHITELLETHITTR